MRVATGVPSTMISTSATATLSLAFTVIVVDPDTTAPEPGAVINTDGATVSGTAVTTTTSDNVARAPVSVSMVLMVAV